MTSPGKNSFCAFKPLPLPSDVNTSTDSIPPLVIPGTPRLGRWVSHSEPNLPSLLSTSTCCKTTLIKGLASPPTPCCTVSHRRARGWEQERQEAKILRAISPTYAGKAQGWDFCFTRKPPSENYVWNCFSQPQELYMLRLGLIYTHPLERECILFAGYF